jgi:broad-specificity NMP kinase
MIVLINGSFGVGKTTVAKLLREALTGSAIYDPEWAGIAMMHLPRWVKLKGSGTGDFQNIDLWRSSVVAGVRLFRLFASGPVIVPMTFSHRAYFDEIVSGFKRLEPELRVFCLKAGLPTIKTRLVGRGTRIEGTEAEWIARRIVECTEAHCDAHFGEPIETEDRTAREVAEEIATRLQQSAATTA